MRRFYGIIDMRKDGAICCMKGVPLIFSNQCDAYLFIKENIKEESLHNFEVERVNVIKDSW